MVGLPRPKVLGISANTFVRFFLAEEGGCFCCKEEEKGDLLWFGDLLCVCRGEAEKEVLGELVTIEE